MLRATSRVCGRVCASVWRSGVWRCGKPRCNNVDLQVRKCKNWVFYEFFFLFSLKNARFSANWSINHIHSSWLWIKHTFFFIRRKLKLLESNLHFFVFSCVINSICRDSSTKAQIVMLLGFLQCQVCSLKREWWQRTINLENRNARIYTSCRSFNRPSANFWHCKTRTGWISESTQHTQNNTGEGLESWMLCRQYPASIFSIFSAISTQRLWVCLCGTSLDAQRHTHTYGTHNTLDMDLLEQIFIARRKV